LRVLVADDHEGVRKSVAAILDARPELEVIDASNGQEAVSKAKDLSPDVIILDIGMPVMDGFAAAKQIRAFLPRSPILFFSNHQGASVVTQARLLGAQGFVAKDEASGTLLHAIDSVLRKRDIPGSVWLTQLFLQFGVTLRTNVSWLC
jgi:DNA-binding NarL/FixJ family response regulator